MRLFSALLLAFACYCASATNTGSLVTVYYDQADDNCATPHTITLAPYKAGCRAVTGDPTRGSVKTTCTANLATVSEYPPTDKTCSSTVGSSDVNTVQTSINSCVLNPTFNTNFFCDSVLDAVGTLTGYDVEVVIYDSSDTTCAHPIESHLTKSGQCLVNDDSEIRVSFSNGKASGVVASISDSHTCDQANTMFSFNNVNLGACTPIKEPITQAVVSYVKILQKTGNVASIAQNSINGGSPPSSPTPPPPAPTGVSTGAIVTVYFSSDDASCETPHTVELRPKQTSCVPAEDGYHGSTKFVCTETTISVSDYPPTDSTCASPADDIGVYTVTVDLDTCDEGYNNKQKIYCDRVPTAIANLQGYDIEVVHYPATDSTCKGAARKSQLTKNGICLVNEEYEMMVTVTSGKVSAVVSSSTLAHTCTGIEVFSFNDLNLETCYPITGAGSTEVEGYFKVYQKTGNSNLGEAAQSSPSGGASSSAGRVWPSLLAIISLTLFLVALL